MSFFTLKGFSAEVRIGIEKDSSKVVADLRKALAKRKVPPEAAERIIDDLLVAALTRLGRNFEKIKGTHIDTVIQLRGELDGLFVDVFIDGSGKPGGIKAALDERLPRINKCYKQLDKAMAEAVLPLDQMKLANEIDEAAIKAVQDVAEPVFTQADRPIDADLAKETKHKHRIARKLREFEELADGGFKGRFDDGTETVLRIENGRYTAEIYLPPGMKPGVRPLKVREFQVSIDPYGVRVRATGLLQRNHVIQNAPMEAIFGTFGYDGNNYPTMWLRDSRSGSPHGKVTANQRQFKNSVGGSFEGAEKLSRGIKSGKAKDLSHEKLNLGELQERGIGEMKKLGASESDIAEYLRVWDAQFRKDVLPKLNDAVAKGKMSPEQLHSLLGKWDARTGLAR